MDNEKTNFVNQLNQLKKINFINQLLEPYGVAFSFACFDLATYTPSLVKTKVRPPANITFHITTSVVDNRVQFWLRRAELSARNEAEYHAAKEEIKRLLHIITACTLAQLEVPEYQKEVPEVDEK